MNTRRLLIALVLGVGLALGALREFLFINLNYQLDFVRHGRAVSYAHSLFRRWVAGWELTELTVLKWVLAGGYVAVMGALCVALAHLLWGDHRYRRLLVLGYATLAMVALGLQALSTLMVGAGDVAVQLLHALQYPLVLFLLLVVRVIGRSDDQMMRRSDDRMIR